MAGKLNPKQDEFVGICLAALKAKNLSEISALIEKDSDRFFYALRWFVSEGGTQPALEILRSLLAVKNLSLDLLLAISWEFPRSVNLTSSDVSLLIAVLFRSYEALQISSPVDWRKAKEILSALSWLRASVENDDASMSLLARAASGAYACYPGDNDAAKNLATGIPRRYFEDLVDDKDRYVSTGAAWFVERFGGAVKKRNDDSRYDLGYGV